MNNSAIEAPMRKDIFQLIDSVYKKLNNHEKSERESRRLLEKVHKEYVPMGPEIPEGPQRDRLKVFSKRLSELRITFRSGIWLTPQDPRVLPSGVNH